MTVDSWSSSYRAPRSHLHAMRSTRSGDGSLRHFAEKIRQVKSDDFIPAKLHRPQSESKQVNVQAVTHLDRRRENFCVKAQANNAGETARSNAFTCTRFTLPLSFSELQACWSPTSQPCRHSCPATSNSVQAPSLALAKKPPPTQRQIFLKSPRLP